MSVLSIEGVPQRAARRRGPWSRWWSVAVVAGAVVVAMLHVLAVSHHYFVGSFDDDANYILTGRAFLAGQGLTGHLTNGDPIVGGYPPGFPALLVPVLWVFGHSFVPLRLLSAAFFAAAFPLTWYYLGRRGFPQPVRVAVVVLMALNPVVATFASMVMAETPFICCALLLLIAADRWEATDKVLSPIGVATILLGAETVWLKEAAIGLTLGLILWLAVRRKGAKAVGMAVGLVALLVPVVVARLIDHVPLAGARYSQELGAYYNGGLVDRLVHVLPSGLHTWLTTALPNSIAPWGAPLRHTGAWHVVARIVELQFPVFVVLGLLVTIRRYRDAAVLAVPVYVAETLLWPQVNERRVILVLPVLLAWYAVGVWTAVDLVLTPVRRRGGSLRPGRAAVACLGVLAVGVPLMAQFSRDYLFGVHQVSSRPQGSRYMAILRDLGVPGQLVETDYKYTTALLTGHRTADNAFLAELAHVSCSLPIARSSLAGDGAATLLLGALNKPNLIDNPCLFSLATTQPWAVRLLRTSRDEASVFELIGPGTAHPDLVNLLATSTLAGSGGLRPVPVGSAGAGDHPGDAETTAIHDGTASLTWSMGADRAISQLSVGEAGTRAGAARGVELQLLQPDAGWVTVARAPGAVGDGPGQAPFLLATLRSGTRARAVRVVVHGSGQAIALDVSALGPSARTLP